MQDLQEWLQQCGKNYTIDQLRDLQILTLKHTQIKLPDSIGNLSNLWELHLIKNQISELPDSIGEL